MEPNNNIIGTHVARFDGSGASQRPFVESEIHLQHKEYKGYLWQIVKYTPNYFIQVGPSVKVSDPEGIEGGT